MVTFFSEQKQKDIQSESTIEALKVRQRRWAVIHSRMTGHKTIIKNGDLVNNGKLTHPSERQSHYREEKDRLIPNQLEEWKDIYVCLNSRSDYNTYILALANVSSSKWTEL